MVTRVNHATIHSYNIGDGNFPWAVTSQGGLQRPPPLSLGLTRPGDIKFISIEGVNQNHWMVPPQPDRNPLGSVGQKCLRHNQ